MAENPEFIRLLQYCNNHVQPVSELTLRRDITALYTNLFDKVQQQLLEHCERGGKISLTVDVWSRDTGASFLQVTGHYRESQTWQFKSVLLGVEQLQPSYIADGLAHDCLSILRRFKLEHRVRAITTDGAPVHIKMLGMLDEKYIKPFNLDDCHIRCMAHAINSSAQQLLSHLRVPAHEGEEYMYMENSQNMSDSVADILLRVRKIITQISASDSLGDTFDARASAAKVPPLQLTLDVRVRYVRSI